MKKKLLLLLAVASTCFALPYSEGLQKNKNKDNHFIDIPSIVNTKITYLPDSREPQIKIEEVLSAQAPTLNKAVINKVATTFKCANEYNVEHNNILTVIDYSLPSSEKRLWVFDLKEQKLLFNTYVSHGINSGGLLTQYFSNKNNSKASSMGVYRTEKSYHGRHGLSLQLQGLDQGFNDNASSRAVVMHGGWYVDERFIKKYGRAGRSWGCPAVPDDLSQPIIDTIKDASLFVVYYPSDNWFLKSKFQTCEHVSPIKSAAAPEAQSLNENKVPRENILFADINKNNRHEESEPVVVMMADNYERTFHAKAPLERMLRRQINNAEYIALSDTELENMAARKDTMLADDPNGFNAVSFVIPVVKMQRGYYATEMQFVPLGKIKEVTLNGASSNAHGFTLNFETRLVHLRPTNVFIRWVGL
jgi:hypothetical protein